MAFDHQLLAELFAGQCPRFRWFDDLRAWGMHDGTRFRVPAKTETLGAMGKLANGFRSSPLFCSANGPATVTSSIVKGALELAQPLALSDSKEYDMDYATINTPSALLDMSTRLSHPHSTDQKLTRCTAVDPDFKAHCPRWVRFIDEITADSGGTPRPNYAFALEVLLAASLAGYHKHQKFLLMYGRTGRNGKNVLFEVLEALLGSAAEGGYFATATPDIFMVGKDKDNEGLVPLVGSRFVAASEPSGRLDHVKLKALTGEDKLTFRQLYVGQTTALRTFTPWMATNGDIDLKSADPAVVARMRVLPFDVSFAGREDPKLAETLIRDEGPAILSRLISLAIAWLEEGAPAIASQEMLEATREWLDEQPTLQSFIAERLERGERPPVAECVTLDELYYELKQHRRGEERAEKRSQLKNALEVAGFVVAKTERGMTIRNGRLRPGVELRKELDF